MFSYLALLAVFAAAQGRAVNISSTWVLPEEGFPVFYRYFRDRISWYEADAVCQFHHANLVTVDTTAQYDAVRAYLKELDISTAVWVGLIRSNPDGEFTWTDYRGLSGEGYWSSAPDARTAPLCAAADPAADYRWEARTCGGPTVASFICELPVPQWALGNEGCMVRNLPALTVLYLPESAAVQLTVDCGLAGVRRVQCTGNMSREVLLKELACADEETTTISEKIETAEITTQTDDITTEDNTMTSTEKVTVPEITFKAIADITVSTSKAPIGSEKSSMTTRIHMNKITNIDFINHNNIQSNEIPRIAGNDDEFMEERIAKMEDEKTKQQILFHEQIARHGNFENGDHFVPPLVMAKAKISDDMTVLSLKEKHAQQLAQQGVLNYENTHKEILPEIALSEKKDLKLTPVEITNNVKKDIKSHIPKKYNEKYISIKGKYTNPLQLKKEKNEDINDTKYVTPSTTTAEGTEPTTVVNINEFYKLSTEFNPIDLTVIFKEPNLTSNASINTSNSKSAQEDDITHDPTNLPQKNFSTTNDDLTSERNGFSLNDEIIKITVMKEAYDSSPFTTNIFEVTTKVPVFDTTASAASSVETTAKINETEKNTSKLAKIEVTLEKNIVSTASTSMESKQRSLEIDTTSNNDDNITHESAVMANITSTQNYVSINTDYTNNTSGLTLAENATNIATFSNTTDEEGAHEVDVLDEAIDDKDSPLLSGASEPLHRPPRLRRPQQQSKVKKFNPFRILG